MAISRTYGRTPMNANSPHPTLNFSREVAQHYLPDVVYGPKDGIITMFAVLAGVEGAQPTAAVILISV